MGVGGRARGRRVSKRAAEITEVAGGMVISILPRLNNLRIGEHTPDITRSENGTVTLAWPWTGRMEKWLYEEWPELEKGTYGYDEYM